MGDPSNSSEGTPPKDNTTHPEDPVRENPFPADDPQHAVWADATRGAIVDLHLLKRQFLGSLTTVDKPFEQVLDEYLNDSSSLKKTVQKQQAWLVGYIFNRFQIWANRASAIVRTNQDAQDYERWLKSYLDAEMTLWTKKCPARFDCQSFVLKLRTELNRAFEHWIAQALEIVIAAGLGDGTWTHIKHDFQADLEASQECPPFLRPAKVPRLRALGTLRADAAQIIRSSKPQTVAELAECLWPVLTTYAQEVFDAMAEAARTGRQPKRYRDWLRGKCVPAVLEDVCRPIVGQFVITLRYVAVLIGEISAPPEDVRTRSVLWRTYADEVIPGDTTKKLETRLGLMLREERVPHWESEAAAPQSEPTVAKRRAAGRESATEHPKTEAIPRPAGEGPDGSRTAKRARAMTVARIIEELNTLKPQIVDEADYRKLNLQFPAFLTFKAAATRADLKTKVLSIAGSARHIRLAQELAAAHHGRELATIQDDWKDHKPLEFKRVR